MNNDLRGLNSSIYPLVLLDECGQVFNFVGDVKDGRNTTSITPFSSGRVKDLEEPVSREDEDLSSRLNSVESAESAGLREKWARSRTDDPL